MNQKNTILVILLFYFISIVSCKKMDLGVKEKESVVERFLNLPKDANPILKRIISDLRTQEYEKPFIEKFVRNEGYPIWSKAKINLPNSNPTNTNKDNVDGADTTVTVAIVLDSAVYVKDILKIKLNNDIIYKLYEGEKYALNGFDKSIERTQPNADDIVAQILGFERQLFGDSLVKITDTRLFNYFSEGERPSTLFIANKLVSGNVHFEWVCDWTVGGNLADCPPGADHCLQIIPVYCFLNFDIFINDGSDDGSWLPDMPSGGGGPSGGGQLPPSPLPPCNVLGWERVRITNDGKYEGPCTPPTPLPTDDNTNTNPSPCDKLLPIRNIPNILTKIADLKQDIDDPLIDHESAYVFDQNGPQGQKAEGESFGPNTPWGTEASVNYELVPNTLVIIHTHPTVNTLSMFSPVDLASLYAIIHASSPTSSSYASVNSLVFGMINSSGQIYFLTIQDEDDFTDFYNYYLNPATLKNDLNQIYHKFMKNATTTADIEKAYLKMLKEVSSGLALIKSDLNLSNFSILSLDNNNNNVNSSPCI